MSTTSTDVSIMDGSSSKGSQSIANSSLASSRSENQTGSTLSLATSTTSDTLSLPWIQVTDPTEREPSIASTIVIDTNVKPGQYVLQSLFAEYTIQAEHKIEKIMSESLETPLAKYLQRGEDPQFDQLLSSLSAVAEHCLPSLLRTLFDWYALQNEEEGGKGQKGNSKTKGEKDYLSERRDLAVDFLFCLVLIEVLKQLPVHPVPDSLINHIETLAFKHFKHREGLQAGPNIENFHIIADLYAEVLGVLAQTRFMSVRKRFLTELKELRSEPQNVQTTQAIISLIMGMKFYRVKMFPVEDFEASFQLLHECANYYLEVKDKDIKHALAGLLVEILVPVAACVKNEVNIPVLKNFVDKLYQMTLDQCGKKKHTLAAFPLVTCLLCVSQKTFFLSNWHNFLGSCLTHLKHREPKMSRVALESLYRLLWVYVIRIKCESNTTTNIRLQSIIKSLFPSSSKYVVPRDTPLNIFVKIIQFIAEEKLEYAMKDVIFDLLGVHSKPKMIYPERMNIGLRAFLVIADSLQQKDGVPPMPTTARIMPSGNTLRVRKTFLNKQLTEEAAKNIGVHPYYPSTRKALDNIIRSLDQAVGRNLLMTNAQCVNKELDDLMTSERKPKIELFRTSVAAIPRVIPDGMSRKELLELLSRLTVHRDDELRGLAFTALQNVIVDLPEWREDVISCFINFILKEVYDTFPLILESALKMSLQLLTQWKTTVQSKEDKVQVKPPYERNPYATILNLTEGFALVFLCSCRPLIRRLSYFLLKEVRALFGILGYSRVDDDAVIDVIDRVCPFVVESFLNQLPPAEKATITAATNIDLHWVLERSINQWSGSTYESTPSDSLSSKSLASRGMGGFDPWITSLARFFDSNCLPHYCPSAVNQAWPVVHTRLMQLYSHIDPNAPSEGRTSIRSTKKTLNPMDDNIALWRNYLVFACSCVPPSSGYQTPRRCLSPEPISGNDGSSSSHSDKQDIRTQLLSSGASAATLFKLLVPLIRCDNTDTREAVVNGLGWTNTFAFRDLMDELQVSFMKDAVERKQENMRRKRRRDFLRVHLIRVFELLAEHQVFKETYSGSQNKDGQALHTIFVEYIEGMRLFLESEGDKDSPTLQEIRLHYAGFVHRLIRSISPENRTNLLPRDVRYSVFFLCGSWCRRNRVTHGAVDRSSTYKDESISDLEMEALQAMGALLVCGEVFDPNAFTQEGYLYSWLDNLLNCNDERVHQLGKETFMLLLENNPQLPMVLQWGTARCYTGPQPVANGYFQAMATVLNSNEDYPCESIQTLCVILFKTADPCSTIRNMALRLLQVMDKRFFSGSDEGMLRSTYGKSHTTLSHELARLHPELTMPVFLEITERFESAPLIHRTIMLECLQHWLYNIELMQGIDERGDVTTQTEGCKEKEPIEAEDHDYGSPLKKLGWGSKAATDIVLNNLFFITAEYGDDHAYELGQLWATLCTCWPGNLRVILNYLMMLAGVMTNPDLLPYVKRVMAYIGCAKPQKLIDELMKEMLSIETVNSNVERTDEPPYFQLFDHSKTSEVSAEIGSMASLRPKMHNRKDKYEGSSDKSRSADKGILDKSASEKSFRDIGSHEKATQVQVQSLISGKGSSGQSDEVWKERDKSSSTLTRSEGSSSALHHSNSSLATLTSSTSHSSGSTTTGGSVDKSKVTPSPAASVIREEEEQDGDLVDAKGDVEEKVEEEEEMEKDLFLYWRQQVLGLGVVVPLPLPDDPYCAPLCDFINDNEAPPSGILHRCNLATVLMTDLVEERLDIDWSVHLPHILHVLFLGLDHSWSMVHEHCKRLLLNLLIVLAPHNDFVYMAQTLLSYHTISDINALTDPHLPTKDYNFTGGSQVTSTHPADVSSELTDITGMGSSATLGSSTISVSSSGSTATVIPSGLSGLVQINVEHLTQEDEAAKALVEFLVTRKCRPLWHCEEITPRVFTVKSAEQMETFLRHVVRIFQGSARGAHLEQRWAQVALQLALSCPSRHYAGRSFQIFRGLNPPLTSCMLSNILARLVETVADQGEENQGYVTEILLTLESAIDNVTSDLVFTDVRERQRAGSSRRNDFRRSTSNLYYNLSPSGTYEGAKRHTVSATKILQEGATCSATNNQSELRAYTEHRGRSATTSEIDKSRFNRTGRSTHSLKMSESTLDDKLNLLAQLFWVFVSLLESDYEYEFLMALRCLDKLLRCLPLDQTEIKNKLEAVCSQLHWEVFPGLQGLLLKGFTSSLTTELTMHLVARLTVYTHLRVVDPNQAGGFPLNIVALLPYLIQHFEQPDRFACEIATNIGKVCAERYPKMAPLSTVLGMYRERTYNRDSKAWTSVVCKYLHNAYSQFSIAMMTFLIEVLEKGPMINQASVLQIVYNLLHNIDLMSAPMQQVNDNLLRVIAKYVQGMHWQESLNILKVAVSKSSSIVKPPTIPEEGNGKKVPLLDLEIRKELPGRTMEFTFDLSRVVEPGSMSNTPVIRRKFPSMTTITTSFSDESAASTLSSDDSSLSTEPTELTNLTGVANGVAAANQNVVPSAWRKPQLSQKRTRERLCCVLKGLGQKVGFERSPSVIFSSTSDIAEPHHSLTSSESTSAIDKEEDEQDFTGHHRYFDFLDGEEENNPSDQKGFNWFDSRHSLEDIDSAGNQIPDDDHKDTSDDESLTGPDDMPQNFKGSGGIQYFFPGTPGDGQDFQRGGEGRDSHSGSYSSGSDRENPLPPTIPARSAFIYIPVDEVEDVWRGHVDSILSDASGRCAVNTCHTFTQLYKVMQQRFCNLTREACNYLGDKLRGIALQFLNTLDVLTTHAECPFVYLDTQTLASCHLLERQKRCVIELQEHYYTYISKRDSALQCLDSIKSSLKLHSLGAQEMDAPSGEEQEMVDINEQIELCRRLYRLYCQLRMLFDSYCKLVNMLSTARQSSQDYSREVSAAKEELIQAAQELESGQASLSPDFDTSRLTPDTALLALAERLGNRELRRALRFLHVCRSMWSGELFGSSEEDDQDVLLALLCKQLTEGKSGVLVITRSSSELAEACNKLMDTNMQLMASLKVTETLETKDVVSMSSATTTPVTDAPKPITGQQQPQEQQPQQQKTLQLQQKTPQQLQPQQKTPQQLQPQSKSPQQLQPQTKSPQQMQPQTKSPQQQPQQPQQQVPQQPQQQKAQQQTPQQQEQQQQSPQQQQRQPEEQVSQLTKQPADTKDIAESLAKESVESDKQVNTSTDDTRKDNESNVSVLETVDVVEVLGTPVEEQMQDVGSSEQVVAASSPSNTALSKDGFSPDEGYGPDIDASMSEDIVEEETPSVDQTVDKSDEQVAPQEDDKDDNQTKMKTSESGIEIPANEMSPIHERPKVTFKLSHSRSPSTASDIEATTAIAVLEQAVQQAYESMTKQAESSEPLSDNEEGASTEDLKFEDETKVEDDEAGILQEDEASSSLVIQDQVPPLISEKVQDAGEVGQVEGSEDKTEDVKPEEDNADALVQDGAEDEDEIDETCDDSKNSSKRASNDSLSTDL